jgi:hypothetical protein
MDGPGATPATYEKSVRMPLVREIEAKSIPMRSWIYGCCVDPYPGSEVGCLHRHAALCRRRYGGHSKPRGEFVDVKISARAALASERYSSR